MPQTYIGTSGWVYPHWEGIFYPQKLSSKEKLKYFTKHFNTVEVNYSFYHLPKETTFKDWYKRTPSDFLFVIKTSRYITHIKRLKNIKRAWKKFIKKAQNLKEKLGPVLVQFPPSFKFNTKNQRRLEEFLSYTKKNYKKQRIAVEFRHKTWLCNKVYKILEKTNTAWVIADWSGDSKKGKATTNFVYFRCSWSPEEIFF